MSEKIEPALSRQEWNEYLAAIEGWRAANSGTYPATAFSGQSPADAVARNNAALPDDDSRKLSILDVRALRRTADRLAASLAGDLKTKAEADDDCERLRRLARIVESYLPPER